MWVSSRQIHWSRAKERRKDTSKRLSQDAHTLEGLSIRPSLPIRSGVPCKSTTQRAEGEHHCLDGIKEEMGPRWTVAPETPSRRYRHIKLVSPTAPLPHAHALTHCKTLVYVLYRKALGKHPSYTRVPCSFQLILMCKHGSPPWATVGVYNTWYKPMNKSVYPSRLEEKSQCQGKYKGTHCQKVKKGQIVCFHPRNEEKNECMSFERGKGEISAFLFNSGIEWEFNLYTGGWWPQKPKFPISKASTIPSA